MPDSAGLRAVWGRIVSAALARTKIRDCVATGDEALEETLEGDRSEWRDVVDEVSTLCLFGGKSRRLVLVQDAADFVTKYRSQLEAYVEHPRATGVLVLDVDTWPATTRLYKGWTRRAYRSIVGRRTSRGGVSFRMKLV